MLPSIDFKPLVLHFKPLYYYVYCNAKLMDRARNNNIPWHNVKEKLDKINNDQDSYMQQDDRNVDLKFDNE